MLGYRSDLIGQHFGALTVIGIIRRTRSGTIWECVCKCGGFAEKQTSSLTRRNGGCRQCWPSRASAANTRHGAARQNTVGVERIYRIWKGMRARCSDGKNKYYGAKGVRVCGAWDRFESFKSWSLSHGYLDDLTIDRVNPELGYRPDNCQWITKSENSRRVLAGVIARKRANFEMGHSPVANADRS